MEGLTLDPSRTALLLIDFQNDIVSPGGKMAPGDQAAQARFEDAIASAFKVAAAARSAGVMVVNVAVGRQPGAPVFNPHAPMFRYMEMEEALEEGSEGFDFHPDMQPADTDFFVIKRGVSAFAGTELGPLLQGQGIDTILIAGIVTHWAVEGTARHASDLGYRVIALADCCASGASERHAAALENIAVIGEVAESAEVIAALA